MSSELRKSLESIQSLLSQNPSPMTATSLSSRIHRASLESGLETHPADDVESHREERRGGSLNEEQHRRSGAVSFHRASAGGGGETMAGVASPPSSSLAPINEPGLHGHGALEVSTAVQDSPEGRDSLSYTPFNHDDVPQRQRQSQYGGGFDSQGASAPATPFQNIDVVGSVTPFPYNDPGRNGGLGIVGSPSSAFSAVGSGKKSSVQKSSMIGGVGSPPFDAVNVDATNLQLDGGVAGTPSANSVASGALGSVSSASRTGGRTAASSRASGFDATSDQHSHFGGLDTTSTKKHHPDRSRRETSLLVSPVSQRPSLHSRSPQSEVGSLAGTRSGALGSFAGLYDASPPMTGSTAVAAAPPSHGKSGTPYVDASDAESPAPATPFASQHDSSPPWTTDTVVAAAPTSHGAVGTPFVGTPFHDSAARSLSVTPGTTNTVVAKASATNGAARHGPTGTPFVAFSSDTSPPSSSNNKTPATAGLTIHTNLHPMNGRDPTPYHHRSNQSTTTSPYSSKGSYVKNKKDSDASSTRIGRDPPAKSPFPTTINATSGKGASKASFLVTSKGTPNVHSHHYHKDQHETDEQELSMIEEDGSSSSDENQSLVSNVTGPTFVRTPIGRKLKGHAHTPRNNAAAGSGGHSTSGHSHNRAHHHTPRSTAQHNTPGSTTSTALHHTPSKADLLNRPSSAMRESLAQLAATTSHALEEVWDCVGLAPDERATHLADLVDSLAEICEAKVRTEEGVRDQFLKEISEARREWEDICNSLMLDGEEDPVARLRRDPSSRELGRSLQLEYEAVMGRLESLRSVKQAAAADMRASQGRILEAYAALEGCSVEEASRADEMQQFMDVETNLTQAHREAFRSKAEEYEESVTSRSKAIVSLLLDCQSMIQELEVVPHNDVCFGLDAKIMDSLEPNEDSEDDGHRRGQSNHYTIVSLFESPTCIGIGKSALDRLTNRIAELNGEKRRRRVKLGEMGSAIQALWSMLRVSQEEQRAFTTSIRGLGLDTLRKGEAEIARLDELKSVMIGKLVREQRQKIEELWDKTNSSTSERASFNAYFHIHDDEQLTDEVLVKHEEYVATLQSKLGKMQPILDLISKREAIIEERIELEFLQKDPDRLKGRHASKQLMKEEQMNRRVRKELPRITSNLEKALWQWYEENKPYTANEEEEAALDPDLGHFMYQGSPYLGVIQCQEEEWRTRKERGEQERQRKRQEERVASSSANAAFGHTAYSKLPGKKWNPSTNTHATNADAPQVPGPVLHRLSAQGQICAPDRTCDQEDHIQQRAVTTLRALARTCVLAVADHWGMSAAAGRIDRRRGREGAPAGGEAQEEAARTEGGRRFLQEEEADIVQHLRLV
eukprot:CAMPEP_0172561768 /NCGR_PEP_ID=MMETSP1067-20121228/94184_1 /TAXON_ID=265564 ORGANISM="Thalassiosira punctigera, Strain Tpunct2005C2" /NCGR_SAMPLE_ID=MMETSP1067 /ASSEMBLY_ACC=CAM_ASM_000444 /LENGTH=1353 /DNA_ID=CAMNT_0013351877 /DNA_START=72 /DNA_END=4134 /DNA_ORIENTATION=-